MDPERFDDRRELHPVIIAEPSGAPGRSVETGVAGLDPDHSGAPAEVGIGAQQAGLDRNVGRDGGEAIQSGGVGARFAI
jgi:hypothetical protein